MSVLKLIDWHWWTAVTGLPQNSSEVIAYLKAHTASECAQVLNPLVDLGWLERRYFGANCDRSTAYEIASQYVDRFLPMGVSPHPLIYGDVYRICEPEAFMQEDRGLIESWVEHLLKNRDQQNTILPFVDRPFVEMQLKEADQWHNMSAARFYLGIAWPKGISPHRKIDPAYLYASRAKTYPTRGQLKDRKAFLTEQLRFYIETSLKNGTGISPSAAFDEKLVRQAKEITSVIKNRRALNALHARALLAKKKAPADSKTGLHLFDETVPFEWWSLARLRRAKAHSIRPHIGFQKEAIERLSRRRIPSVFAAIDGDLPFTVKAGEMPTMIIIGRAISFSGPINKVELNVGGSKTREDFQAFPRPDRLLGNALNPQRAIFCGFAIFWAGRLEIPARVTLRFKMQGCRSWSKVIDAGSISVEPRFPLIRRGKAPQVAIAMATYNPDPILFEKQIQSIRSQTLEDWRLTIADESSSVEARELIATVVANDSRISLNRGSRRNFLGNFERALRLVDRRAPYFAFCDQDDVWYPKKLETLVKVLENTETSLAYCDMRIVKRTGRLIEPTFFSWRQPHDHTVEQLLVANVATGAALVGDMKLLEYALPFPRFHDLYHDWWLALIASATSGISFHGEVLQDYIQHANNTLGHSSHLYRRTAARFRRETRAFESKSMNISSDIRRLTNVWIAMLQRAMLRQSLKARLGVEQSEAHVLSIPSLQNLARSLLSVGSSERKFLNIQGWLFAGMASPKAHHWRNCKSPLPKP